MEEIRQALEWIVQNPFQTGIIGFCGATLAGTLALAYSFIKNPPEISEEADLSSQNLKYLQRHAEQLTGVPIRPMSKGETERRYSKLAERYPKFKPEN